MLNQQILKEYLNYNQENGIFTWLKKPDARANRIVIGNVAGFYSNGYLRIGLLGKEYLAHRLAWLYVHGEMPNSMIDHKDGNPSNNKISNLRVCDQYKNQQNRKSHNSNNKNKCLGVSFVSKTGKYRATIYKNWKQKHLGSFNTPEEAHQAYLLAKRQIHEFCTI